MAKVTMESIAAELGISKNTVSRALRGLSGVSDEVRRKITARAEGHGYKIKNKSTVMRHITMIHLKSLKQDNFFWPSVLSGIMNFAADRGISIRAVTVESGKDYRNSVLSVKSQQCDGIVIVNDIDDECLKLLAATGLPMVAVDYFNDSIECDYVISANRNGVYKALSYFISCNHKKIGYIGNKNWRFSYQARYDAYRYYMNEFGLPIDENYVWLKGDYNDLSYFQKKIDKTLIKDDAPTAWLCVNDVMATDFSNALNEAGYTVPDDFSLIGFDNSTYPGAQSLTTLEIQMKALGQRAVEQLLLRMDNPKKPYETLSINANLIIRNSVKNIEH